MKVESNVFDRVMICSTRRFSAIKLAMFPFTKGLLFTVNCHLFALLLGSASKVYVSAKVLYVVSAKRPSLSTFRVFNKVIQFYFL